ncbi:MAG: polyisoprenoid-binding protein [Alphaproteobacteria bacterium]|nr:polyisoprenoid-binding protein [Alphaproteobacteria bacterium]
MTAITTGFRTAALGVFLCGIGLSAAAETFKFDKGHTEVRFLWNHVGLSTQSGEFRAVDGSVTFDSKKLGESKVDVTIKSASIDTGVERLDKHLKSGDFFNVEKHPEITFKSTSVRQTGVDRGQVIGNLTMNGVTKPVTLDVSLLFQGNHPLAPFIKAYAGAPYVAFSGRTEVLRSDFNLGKFAPLTSDAIEIVIQTEMRKAAE